MSEPALLDQYIEVYLSAFKNIGALVSEPMQEDNISFEQFLIMRDLAAGRKLTLSEIARHRNVTRAAITRQVKTLVEQDDVVQEPDPKDRRRLYLRLTPHGEDVTARINAAVRQRFDLWVETLGAHDAKELLRIMTKVGTHIIAKRPVED